MSLSLMSIWGGGEASKITWATRSAELMSETHFAASNSSRDIPTSLKYAFATDPMDWKVNIKCQVCLSFERQFLDIPRKTFWPNWSKLNCSTPLVVFWVEEKVVFVLFMNIILVESRFYVQYLQIEFEPLQSYEKNSAIPIFSFSKRKFWCRRVQIETGF